MRRPVLAALVFSLCAPGLASVQAEPRIAMIGLDQPPEAVADEYVRALDDMLEELAAEGGLPAPASSAPVARSIAASVARDTQPMTSWSTVSMGVSVAVAQFGQPGVADQPGPPTDTTEADCRAR